MKAYLRMIYCNFLQIIREPIIIIVYIGFPIIFVFLFGMAFSQENQSFSVGIVEAEDEVAVIELLVASRVKMLLILLMDH